MDYLTSTMLAGMLYDGIKSGAKISTEFLAEKLRNWVVSEKTIERIKVELGNAGIHEDMGEHAIARNIDNHPELLKIMNSLKNKGNSQIVNQTSKTGHNIVADGSASITIGNNTSE